MRFLLDSYEILASLVLVVLEGVDAALNCALGFLLNDLENVGSWELWYLRSVLHPLLALLLLIVLLLLRLFLLLRHILHDYKLLKVLHFFSHVAYYFVLPLNLRSQLQYFPFVAFPLLLNETLEEVADLIYRVLHLTSQTLNRTQSAIFQLTLYPI